MSILSEVSTPMASSMLPVKSQPKPSGSTVYLQREVWARLDAIAAETKAEDPEGVGYSRNEVIQRFLDWAIREYDAERRSKKKG